MNISSSVDIWNVTSKAEWKADYCGDSQHTGPGSHTRPRRPAKPGYAETQLGSQQLPKLAPEDPRRRCDREKVLFLLRGTVSTFFHIPSEHLLFLCLSSKPCTSPLGPKFIQKRQERTSLMRPDRLSPQSYNSWYAGV